MTTVADYLAALPPERREAIEAVRAVILENLDPEYEEGIQYGMIGYYVPHSRFPAGYHCDPKQPLPFAALAAQKNYMSLYLMCISMPDEQEWFAAEWAKSGKKLDKGRSCVRFKNLADLDLPTIGTAIGRISTKSYVDAYVASRSATIKKKR